MGSTAGGSLLRSAPSALRNREPIAEVLKDWLPGTGTVLEVASGTGEHAAYFAERFPALVWQPSDLDPECLSSIEGWRAEADLGNLQPPIQLNAAGEWPEVSANAILCINMAHISPWEATLGVLRGAERLLGEGMPLLFYGPWLAEDVPTALSNKQFDAQLRARNPAWGIRWIERLVEAAATHGLSLEERRAMPANNFMLLFRRGSRLR